jgi:hypothetical protein
MKYHSRLAFCVATLAIPGTCFAQGAGGGVLETCKTEIASLCADAGGKGGAAFRCLADNQAKLGGACAEAMKTAQERRQKIRAACQTDIDKLCAGTEGAGGGVMQCLRSKAAELSKGCADVLATLPAPAGK